MMRRRLRAGAAGQDTPARQSWTIEAPPAAAPAPVPAGPVVAGAPASMLAVRGLLLGGAAAALAAWAWAAVVALTGMQIGFAAIAVGLLVGGAVRLGSGGLASPVTVAGSVVLTLVSMAAAEYLIVREFTQQMLAAEGFAGTLPLWLGLPLMLEVIVDSLAADPLTLAFWAFAMLAAWRLAATVRD